MKVYIPIRFEFGKPARLRPYLHAGQCTLKLKANENIKGVEVLEEGKERIFMTRKEWLER